MWDTAMGIWFAYIGQVSWVNAYCFAAKRIQGSTRKMDETEQHRVFLFHVATFEVKTLDMSLQSLNIWKVILITILASELFSGIELSETFFGLEHWPSLEKV